MDGKTEAAIKATTPMMAQYLAIKDRHPDALLFYRMGDFYELFFEDAKAAAAALDIALTQRGQHAGQPIPMCGVPHHAAEAYLLTLIRKGFRVAVCEQLESPEAAKKRGAKSVVRRDVVRLITPGTLTEERLLEGRRNNYLAAYIEMRGEGGLAWADLSTGDLVATPCPRVMLPSQLAKLSPSEILVPDAMADPLRPLAAETGAMLTPLGGASFQSSAAEARVTAQFGLATLDALGAFSRQEVAALGAILDYLALTQIGQLPLLKRPERERPGGTVEIDAATRRNLELTEALDGGRKATLLSVLDRTVTAAGARLLAARLTAPITDLARLSQRQDAVAHLVADPDLAEDLQTALRQAPDMERALSRLALGRGTPRDLAALRDGLGSGGAVASTLTASDPPEDLARAADALTGFDTLSAMLTAALVAEPPALARDGGFIAPGYDPALDAARRLRDDGKQVIAGLQEEYRRDTGIAALKVKHNAVLGYFVETPATHSTTMLAPPLAERFIHRQTTANQIRFTTVALSDLQSKILSAGAEAQGLEEAAFATLTKAVLAEAASIGLAARALAEIDLSRALAERARQGRWTRPGLSTDRRFEIHGGRHPVVEAALEAEGKSFVANDCRLTPETAVGAAAWILTGPNMAGKSTFLRQNALLAVLAQMGSFVPAETAEIGLVDQIFSRVGAADDLARGRSTFMVEMVETATILNQAGPQALVILDEIGRGTATYDGLSIAWAALEHLVRVNRCRALFATHYHELTALADREVGLTNATVAVREWEGSVVFLHEVRAGVADRSYGIHVARLAGLPETVVARARDVLAHLEAEGGEASVADGLPLFDHRPPTAQAPKADLLRDRLAEIDPDALTPREALDVLYALKAGLG